MSGATASPIDERSPDAHRFFFATIRQAFFAWPDAHPDFSPANEHHLRAWLACHDDVRHCAEVDALPGCDLTEAEAIEFYSGQMTAQRAAGGYAFLGRDPRGKLVLRIPRTMKYERNGGLTRLAFRGMCERVYGVLAREVGLDVETLKKEAWREELRPNGFGKR